MANIIGTRQRLWLDGSFRLLLPGIGLATVWSRRKSVVSWPRPIRHSFRSHPACNQRCHPLRSLARLAGCRNAAWATNRCLVRDRTTLHSLAGGRMGRGAQWCFPAGAGCRAVADTANRDIPAARHRATAAATLAHDCRHTRRHARGMADRAADLSRVRRHLSGELDVWRRIGVLRVARCGRRHAHRGSYAPGRASRRIG